MERRYSFVEKMIQAWVLERENHAAGKKTESVTFAVLQDDFIRPYAPSTPLHSTELYWDTQFKSAS